MVKWLKRLFGSRDSRVRDERRAHGEAGASGLFMAAPLAGSSARGREEPAMESARGAQSTGDDIGSGTGFDGGGSCGGSCGGV